MTSDNLASETARRIFADLADPQTITSARTDAWKAPLWAALEENGLTLAWTPEDHGGVGLSLGEGFGLILQAGAFAAETPLADTLLASWLLSQANLASPAGPMTVATGRSDDPLRLSQGRVDGKARGVAFADAADHVVVLCESSDGPTVALVRTIDVTVARGVNLAGEDRSILTFDGVSPVTTALASNGLNQAGLQMMGGVVRAVQTAGALQTILDRTVVYAGERIAFGKPIGKFQAVQNLVARLAGEVAAANAAAGSAADALASSGIDNQDDDGLFLEAASAKIRCAEAAGLAASIAHQVHGAIGLTLEHVLHRFTLRVLSWRDDFGNETEWSVRLGERVAARGGPALWPLIASR